MNTKIIFGIPLSLYKSSEGIFLRYETIVNKRLQNNYSEMIIGIKEQRPDVILYFPKAIVVERGGLLSHLAVACRELRIPLYKVKSIDDILDDEYVKIIPIKKVKFKLKKDYRFQIRLRATDKETLYDNVKRVYKTMEYINREYKFNLKIVNLEEFDKMLILTLHMRNMEKVFNDILQSPENYIYKLRRDIPFSISHRLPIGLFLIQIGEYIISFLANKYGYDAILSSAPKYFTLWGDAPYEYFKVRFDIHNENVIKKIQGILQDNVSRIESLDKNNIYKIRGKDKTLLELSFLIFYLYELKNVLI